MESLRRYRDWEQRKVNRAMGRLSARSRTLDSEVRADSSKWDILRMPVSDVFPCQHDDGTFIFVAGMDEITAGTVF